MTIPPSLAQPSFTQAPFEETDPNAVPKSILDAKGDIITATANDTPARLPVGTNGQVLVANSATTTGLQWATDPTTDIVTTKGDLLVATGPDTLVRLGVGSNNQVLVADSSTTEGVKWSSETDPNSINKSIIDAKGDLVVGTANDTPSRLGVGSNGQYLIADSTATEGVKWATPDITLGTQTTGNYVATISGGTGVTVTGGTGESSTPSVAIGQDVATTATVAFGGLNVDTGTLYVDATNNRVGINDTTPSFSLDVTGDANITTALTVGTTVTASDFVGNLSGILQIDVKNVSGGTLAAGTPVYISGTVGATQVAEVQAARADTASTMPAVGLLETSLGVNATGHAAVIGLVNNLNTSTYTLNAPLYVAPTGGLTNTRPTAATDVVQVVGFAARLNTNTGAVLATIYDQLRAPNAISIPGDIATTGGQFSGSGAGLTSIPAGQLTGTVPSAAIGNDTVALGTKTTGDYVQTLAGGTGVTVTGGTGEGSTPTVAIGQAVATTSSPQFVGLTTTGTANLNAASVTNALSANSVSATTSLTGSTLFVDSIEIDTTGATTNQVLQYNGTKFLPTTLSGGGSIGGSANQVVYKDGTNTATGSANLTFDGTTLTGVRAVIADNSTSNALRITQTGTGNALVVEDSANPDSTPFVIDAEGRVLLGNTATQPHGTALTVNNKLQLAGTTVENTGITQFVFSNSTIGPITLLAKSRGTAPGSYTAVQTNDELGIVTFHGTDGTGTKSGAYIGAKCDGTVSTGIVPGRLEFITTSNTGALIERMRIDSAGLVTIAGTVKVNGVEIDPASPSTNHVLAYNGTKFVDQGQQEVIIIPISDETTTITTGTAKSTFRMPFAMTLTSVRASLTTASTSGLPTFDINESGVSILSTRITIDANEKTSTTAATPPVISDTSLADDAEITIDIDVAGTGAKGAKIYLIGRRT